MYDTRILLEPGSVIKHNGLSLRITKIIGKGGNAVAYKAEYDDTAVLGGIHKCVLKELFPFHPEGLVYRENDGTITCKEEAAEFFEIHKKSFLYGNRMHLSILEKSPDSVGANFDSFEYNGTLYSIIGLNSMTTLSSIREKLISFESVLDIVIKLAKAVDEFHKNNILHLDISPDNVIVSGEGSDSRVLLIDFNSCDKRDGKIGGGLEFASVNRGYSAPEIKMRRVQEVSYTSDVFSVCAVFANLLLGENFVYATTRSKTLISLPIVADLPFTAKSKLVSLISKGLRANSKLRYQSVSELLKALYELRERVENRGISHAALWETSRLLAEEVTSDYIENNLSCNGVVYPSASLISLGNTVISGEGGLGKTTLYKKIQYDSTRVYNSKEPVCFYVPLYRYDGNPDFIKRFILSKIRYSENMSTFSDATSKLLELMREDTRFLFLLLDGINEISADKSELIKEISEISSYKGVGISVSERSDSIVSGGIFDNFSSAVLQGLDDEDVRSYLNKNALAYPSDEKLSVLLRNPLMLKLYTDAEKVFLESPCQRPENNSKEQIIHSYLESICESFKWANPGDNAGIIRLTYITEFLFPAICRECADNTAIDYDTVKKVIYRDYKMLKSRAFSKAFKEYTGKSKVILDGIKNEDEWFDTALNQILIGSTVLVVKENDMYHPMHMSFTEVLGNDSLQKQKKYNSVKRRDSIPKIFAIVALLCTVGVSLFYVKNILKYDKKGEEEIMESVAQAVTNFITITVKEEEVVKRLSSDAFSKEEKIKMLEDAEAILESHEKDVIKYSAGGFRVDLDGMTMKIAKDLDRGLLREIYDYPGDYRENQKRFFAGLEFLVKNDIYSEDLKEACEIYLSYIDRNTELFAGKCAEFIIDIDEERAKPLMRALPENNDFHIYKYFHEAHESDKNSLEKNSSQCQKRIDSMTDRLSELMDVSNDVDEAYEKYLLSLDTIFGYYSGNVVYPGKTAELLGRMYLKDNSEENKQAFLDSLAEIPDVRYIDQLFPELSDKELALVSQKLDFNISKNYKAVCDFSKLNLEYLDWSIAEYFVENGELDNLNYFITTNEGFTELICLLSSVVAMSSAASLDDTESSRFEALMAKYPILKADKMLLTNDAEYSEADDEEYFLWSKDIGYIFDAYSNRESEIVESLSQVVNVARMDEETYIHNVESINEKLGRDIEPIDLFGDER